MSIDRYVALLASCVVLSLATACGSSTDTETPDGTTVTTAQAVADATEGTVEGSSTSDTGTVDVELLDLDAMVDAITSQVEWPSLARVEDSATVSEFFKLDTENPNYEQLLVMQCPMSAVVSEVILVQAYDVDSAMEDLNVRRQKLIDVDAYYPEHKEVAEASIVGSRGNLAYFIADDEAESSEEALLDYLDSIGY